MPSVNASRPLRTPRAAAPSGVRLAGDVEVGELLAVFA